MNLLKKTNTLFLIVIYLTISCNGKQENKIKSEENSKIELTISDTLKWSERMALSIIKRHPKLWQVDDNKNPKWDYKLGLLSLSFEKLYDKTQNQKYFDYVENYAKTVIDSNGSILNYDIEKYNIDMINAGKILFDLLEKTKDERYLAALKTLRKQLEGQSRTESDGFWHKNIYPNQMWLDGLYMGTPFYAQYSAEFENGKFFDDIIKQFELIQKHTFDPQTGLLFHAWDESKKMEWANKETGCSPNFWSRSMGWYAMAIVDVLDYLPKSHSGHEKLVGYLNQLAIALEKFQDEETGLWYQVTNMGGKEGNYLEASGTSMFAYAYAKGVNKGYLSSSFKDVARRAFNGLITQLIKVDEDGEIHITQVCGSAGLGGNPYRDGSFEYYIGEKIKIDNSHGLGPFILAALELDK
ncbi:glycoside hydrolase family 88/105 protein [Lutibacter flavus]|uniref:Unsaturated rhamnogalacturonyl hydrolase n=1 Tax=Lutibacter flavus TaxID=691689 RepID=A0A238V9Q9_9FLAO|nr:glycoside hydrolase family 88 protein [Lutibacter flavus]SNR30864.1 unsaturated rhamnogalacturonyl hydrolase [Lutibacter flavus]